mmetsp:Transcript_37878/g.107016  ORF Transcript_37878/g.107016 Transcript_37878/m.107016 type:complete len:447 (-) Transcript_37878:199-1539(-)|eukprot:CAMPEP_0117664928 /NCGR_PEP_ID=MMETSP0804-20121206/9509_1 /TAXON_ID=1074897 /ORGANISM="Tetraselmis astigmatica, Strain CCMP880" /LENGTH=446 /DNA_ID=CAMNT_0005472249 /DNA_START=646 /DNA_END=1989 /DNA_ORIENTATION=+
MRHCARLSLVLHDLQAQQLAAEVFGANKTWFLVNGTTCGIQAALMATCHPGDYVVLPRNCHQSAFSALIVSGAMPTYVVPEVDLEYGIASPVTAATVEKALAKKQLLRQTVGAVLIVSPTYFGACADTAEIVAVCHRYGVPLVVDEAHGAHLSQHPGLPPGALQQGADVVVQSTHKVLGSMTQSSMLHCQGSRVCHDRISSALQVLQSSSPSYVLMASLDAARLQISDGTATARALDAANTARAAIAAMPDIDLLWSCPSTKPPASASPVDPFRLTCSFSRLGLTGEEAYKVLEQDYGIVAELSTQQVVVFAFGIGTTNRHSVKLVEALEALAATRSGDVQPSAGKEASSVPFAGVIAQCSSAEADIAMSPRMAFFAKKDRVAFHSAEGRISGELLCPYPPGIPVVLPGERLTAQALRQLEEIKRTGGKIMGCSDGDMSSILVIPE